VRWETSLPSRAALSLSLCHIQSQGAAPHPALRQGYHLIPTTPLFGNLEGFLKEPSLLGFVPGPGSLAETAGLRNTSKESRATLKVLHVIVPAGNSVLPNTDRTGPQREVPCHVSEYWSQSWVPVPASHFLAAW
jgi:hypothetical protein